MPLNRLLPSGDDKSEFQDCWWTGCQKNAWSAVGCAHYNRTERDKLVCEDGHKYFCCPKLTDEDFSTDEGSPISETTTSSSTTTYKPMYHGCWWTGCQKNSWAIVGCAHYNL
uniref:Uncharacterized protein n=1 Tax=Tetranychus urticae TaxID=32264 RepID=T1KLX7_TETUR